MSADERRLNDIAAAMRGVAGRVRADTVGVEVALDLRVDTTFAVPVGQVDQRPDAYLVIAAVGERRFAAGFQDGYEAACAVVMSAVQDEVVAALGRPWPELVDVDGRAVGIVDVALEPFGIAHWSLRGEPLCAVGQMVAGCEARGWRVA